MVPGGGLFEIVEIKMLRDTQRARVYKSDAALVAVAKPLPTVKDVERFTRRLLQMKRVRDTFPKSARYDVPRVGDGRGRSRASGGEWEIKIPLWARNEAVVIHELAHTVALREFGRRGDAAFHGWQFCSVYLKLTLYGMGRDAHDALKAAFKKNRVRFTAPRAKRQLTEDQRQALADRLALGRLAAASDRHQQAMAA